MIIKLWLLSLGVSSAGAANNVTAIVQCMIAISDAYKIIFVLTAKQIIYKVKFTKLAWINVESSK